MYQYLFIAVLYLASSSTFAQQNQACVDLPCNPSTVYADITVLIDASTTVITSTYWTAIQGFLQNWVSDYTLGGGVGQTQFAFVTYSSFPVSYGFFPDSWQRNINGIIQGITQISNTSRDINPGLAKVANNLGPGKAGSGYRPGAKHIMVVISSNTFNGPDYSAWLTTVSGIQDVVLAVGLTPESITTQQAELLAMTKGADPNAVQFIAGPDGLGSLRIWLHQQVCKISAGTPVSTNFCVPTPSGCIPKNLMWDIAVLIDTSISLPLAYFTMVQDFLKLWSQQYTIGPGNQQVLYGFTGMDGQSDSYGSYINSNTTAELYSSIDYIRQHVENKREYQVGLAHLYNQLRPTNQDSGYRPLPTKHMIVSFTGAPFTDVNTDYIDEADMLRADYPLFLAISLQYANQMTLYGQYQTVVTGGDPNNIYMISGQESLNSVLSWLLNRQCAM